MYLLIDLIVLVSRVMSVVGILAVVLALQLFQYVSRTAGEEDVSNIPRTAVVFTGDFDRIYTGLDLLSDDKVDRLFITGVNGDAGLSIERFPEQFDLTPEQKSWIEEGRLVFAPDAHTTIENALEAGCWLDSLSGVEAVTLITSQRHMARASIAFQRGTGSRDVSLLISEPSPNHRKYEVDLEEFSRFSATWFVTLLPKSLWPGNKPGICGGG